MANKYFFGKGKLFLAQRDVNGKPGVLYWPGNVASLEVTLETDTLEHTESYSGQNLTDLRIITAKKASFNARVESFDIDALALGMYGNKVTVAGASVTNEALPSGLLAGDEIALANGKVSSLVIKDSAGSSATLVEDTDYSIEDADTGRIKILGLGSYTQPFKADYSYGARKDLGMFLNAAPERWLRYEGINLADNGKKVVVEFYKALIDPMSNLPLISDNAVGGYDLKGSVLVDDKQSATSPLGQFARWIDLA